MNTEPRNKDTSATWHPNWITDGDAKVFPRLSRAKQKKCNHTWRSFVERKPGGWNLVCALCGKRRQNRRRKDDPVRQLTLEST